MPVGPVGNNSNTQPRQTFRPPWVRNDPPPVPMPSQPWVKSDKKNYPPPAEKKEENHPPFGKINLRKVSELPIQKPSASQTPAPEFKLNKVPPPSVKENGDPPKSNPEPKTRSIPVTIETPLKSTAAVNESASKPPQKTQPPEQIKKTTAEAQKPPTPLYRRTSEITIPIETVKPPRVPNEPVKAPDPPKPPPVPLAKGPPAPPPPPPPQPGQQPPVKSELTPEKKQKLDMLRSRPKKRPDWGNMMKEIETGRKLNHVKCNDRSAPLLPKVKAKGQFVYESERPNLHNQLLKQIETGIRLKPTKTNDRSKPFIEGLRKFRRQMTIEEQIQKSASMASLGIVEPEPDPLDEVDDIDKVRDDLQSTKQLLAMELKNKEALERENKKLMTKILNLEVELEKEKHKANKEVSTETSSELQKEVQKLKEEAKKAKELAEDMENKFHDIQGKHDLLKLDYDESIQKNQRLEKQLKVAQAANLAMQQGQPLTKQLSKKIVHQNKVHETIVPPESPDESEEEEEEETETETETEIESEDDEANEEAQKEKRLLREIKLLSNKLQSFKNKKETAKKERKALKEQMTKLQRAIKDEKKNYKVLQKEVDKMSKLMNESDEEEEEDEEEDEEKIEEEEETSEEEDEETEESESEESEGDLPESAPLDKKKINLQSRSKKYENLLSSLKKGNYLLKANLDRYKDELNKQKEMSLTLQEDLNSVLAELG